MDSKADATLLGLALLTLPPATAAHHAAALSGPTTKAAVDLHGFGEKSPPPGAASSFGTIDDGLDKCHDPNFWCSTRSNFLDCQE